MKEIIVTGSIANDYIMGFPGDFREHIIPDKIEVLSVSFLVDSLRREPGGCAANIGLNLAMLAERPRVMATVGGDWAPDRARLESAGVDCSLVRDIADEHTASFFVSTDEGNRQIASFYVGAMARADELSLGDIAADEREAAAAVIIAPNAPAAMDKLVEECKHLGLPYVYDPSQQIVRLTRRSLVEGIEGCRILVANEYELELIQDKTDLSADTLRRMTDTLIVTHGEDGSRIYAGGDVHDIPIAPPGKIVDPTGVGDAYRAGAMLGLLHGVPWPVAGRVGALCATYALEALGTQNHGFTAQSFLERYDQSFGSPPAELVDLLERRRTEPTS